MKSTINETVMQMLKDGFCAQDIIDLGYRRVEVYTAIAGKEVQYINSQEVFYSIPKQAYSTNEFEYGESNEWNELKKENHYYPL